MDDRIEILESLKWAKDNPGFNFKGLMKDTPVEGELKFTNDEIYQYLMDFKDFFENEEFKLLTDDRPPKDPAEYMK